MSANNYVLIKEYADSPKYRISDQCADCEIYEDTYFASSENLEDAIKIAQYYQEEEIVEYGIQVKLLQKQTN